METEQSNPIVMYVGDLAGISIGSVLLPRNEPVEVSEAIAIRIASLGRSDIEGAEDFAPAEVSLDEEPFRPSVFEEEE